MLEFDNAWWIDDAGGDGAAEAFVLGFQHYLTMVGTAVLIPLLIFQTDSGATPVSVLSCSTFFSRLSSVTDRHKLWRPVKKFANFHRGDVGSWCFMLEEVSTGLHRDSQVPSPRCLGLWEFIVSVHF